jgi:hypothetical protein
VAGPTIASAEVDVDFDGRGMPAQARRIANQAGKALEPRMKKVGDRVGREFITGMDGQMRQVPANAMRMIREINTTGIGREKGTDLADGLGEGIEERSDEVSTKLERVLGRGNFHKKGNQSGNNFARGLADGIQNGRARIEAVLERMLSGFGGGAGGAGAAQGGAFGDAFHGGVFSRMDRTVKMVLGLIASMGPQIAALGSALSATLVGALGSAIVGLGGALLILGGPLLAGVLAFKMLKTEFKHLIKRSEEVKAVVKGLSEAWKEQKAAMADAAMEGVLPLIAALTRLVDKSDLGTALGQSVAAIADAFTEVIKSPGFSAFLTALETTFPAALTLFGTALAGITQGLLTMWAAAGPAAVALGESFAGWAANFADAMQVIADSGQLAAFFDTALASLDALFGLINPLAVALGNVFVLGAGPGNEFLGILGQLSEQFLAFTRSAEGAAAITAWFEQANTVAVPLLGLIGSLGVTLADMVTPTVVSQLVEFINALSKGLPIIGELLSIIGEDLGLLNLFTQALRTIGTVITPILPAMSEFATVLGQGLLDTFKALTPVLTVVADVFGRLLNPLGRIVSGLTDFSSASGFAENAARLLPGALRDIGINLADLVDTIADALPDIVTGLTGVLSGIGEGLSAAFLKLGPAVGNLLGVLVGQLATLLPAVVVAATQAFGGLAAGLQAAIPQFVAALPLVVTALGTLVPLLLRAALQLVLALVQGLADNAQMIAEGLLSLLTDAVGVITEALPLVLAAATELVSGLADGLLANLPALLEAAGGLVQAILLALGSAGPSLVLVAWQIMGALADGLIAVLPILTEALLMLLPTIVTAMDAVMPQLIETGVTMMTAVIQGMLEHGPEISEAIIRLLPLMQQAFGDILPLLVEAGVGIVKGVAKGIADNPELVVQAIKDIGNALLVAFKSLMGISSPSTVMDALGVDLMNGMRDGVTRAGENVITFFRELPGRILDQIDGLADDLRTWAGDALTGAQEAFEAGIDGLVTAAGGIAGDILDAVGDLSGTLTGAGKDLVGGLISGIGDAIPGLLAKAGNLAQSVIDKVTGKKGFDEHSPSRVFRAIGADVVAGLVQGMENNARSADLAAAALARGSIGAFDNTAPVNASYSNTRNNNVAAGAIQIVTQTTDPVIAANMVLDRLVTRMA